MTPVDQEKRSKLLEEKKLIEANTTEQERSEAVRKK
jgi:hypothetical protein